MNNLNGYQNYDDPNNIINTNINYDQSINNNNNNHNNTNNNSSIIYPGLTRSISSSSSTVHPNQYDPSSSNININTNTATTTSDPYTYLHSQLGASSLHSQLGASSLRGIVPNIKPTSFNSIFNDDNNGGIESQYQNPHQHQSGPTRISGIAKKKSAAKRANHLLGTSGDVLGKSGDSRKKRTKRSSGKACVYCRRSHMVCEGGRPCERCIKREIPHLCRDFTPPPHQPHHSHSYKSETSLREDSPSIDDIGETSTQAQSTIIPSITPQPQIPVYPDTTFPPTWPLLPNPSNQMQFNSAPSQLNQPLVQTPPVKVEPDMTGNGNAAMQAPSWGTSQDDSELAALNKFMQDLGVPALPGDFFSFMNQVDGTEANNSLQVPFSDDTANGSSLSMADFSNQSFPQGSGGSFVVPGNVKGKGKVVPMSRIDKFMMAAADQPDGTRAARLAQVIKAKYDAGLLKPYDYVKGYERMNKWMESGRAAPRIESRAGSETDSPIGLSRNGGLSITSMTPHQALGKSISPDSRRRILAALAGFRPKFRQIARTLTNVDLVFVEEAMERWMLEYDRAFASIHTPSCIWRRTGEIQKANQEFSNLTGIPASMFRDGQLCVYELMDEESAVRYWEGYAKIAFDQNQRSMYISCTLHIPISLTKLKPRRIPMSSSSNTHTPTLQQHSKSAQSIPFTPDLTLPQSVLYNDGNMSMSENGFLEEFRELKCCFSVTIRRDTWGVPVAIMGQWIRRKEGIM
ncbi:uncharacterized protein IL334_004255 [Kwoniella shivajii]|uniref:Zn(2)-C6 fungal-type domain-containing protein n=1 Tax=Kwoniella shivajii TaxID=564305 RepID=A0ABZ1D0F3_9TREE|nr:hypothetical protein IL334_004255 [Kwoniella shivajii]